MQGYLTIDRGKTETVLFKIGLYLWICSDSNFFKSVILWDAPIIVKSRICTLELQERMWSLILLWHVWEMEMFVLGLTPACSVILERSLRQVDLSQTPCRSKTCYAHCPQRYLYTTQDLKALGRSSL